MGGFFDVSHHAIEIVEPDDDLEQVCHGELELAEKLLVGGYAGDDGGGKNCAGDFFGIGSFADAQSFGVDGLYAGGEKSSDVGKKWYG